MVRDVVILGAGASAADKAPLQDQLISQMLSGPVQRELGQRGQRIRDGLGVFFGIDGTGLFPTMEEALGVLDLALQRQESFRDYPNLPDQSSVAQLREDLVLGIAVCLRKALTEPGVHSRGLVRRLRKENNLLDTAFVSLNYDLLMDEALRDQFPTFHIDYATDFANYDRPDAWQRPQPDKAIQLLKPHGSLNWLFCPACTKLEIYPGEKQVVALVQDILPCPTCQSRMVPIVIPPSFIKTFSNIHLHRIWNRLEEVLRQADRLIFCGYSFPDADLHLKYTLKRAEIGRTEPWDVFIINHHKGKRKRASEDEVTRYTRFFRSKHRIRAPKLSFQGFARNGLGPTN